MEHTHYPESGADGRDALMREEISTFYDSEDSEDDHYLNDPIKYDLSVWLAELDDATDDVPQIPPAFIVYCRGKNSPTGDLGFLFVDLLNSPGCLGLPPNDFILDCPPHLCRAPRQG